MAFDRKTFLGASIKNAQCSIGWNGNSSQLSVSLVEDPTNGDAFNPPEVGQPAYFEIGNLFFYGLLERYSLDKGADGFVYSATLVDPRKLLEKTKLILDSYNASTFGIFNLLNVYGYLENAFGFGGSRINSSGIPWELIRDAILNMVNSPFYGTYGGPITYKGYSYSLNLAELPTNLPSYFRVGTPSSLLEFITIICEYANYDFFFELNGLQIRLKTVPRINVISGGTLTTLINSYSGNNLIRSSAGVEARDEFNTAFLVGGEVTSLYRTDEIVSFWGLDINNNPITGVPGVMNFTNAANEIILSEEVDFFTLDASVVSDLIASTAYPCTDFELRIVASGGTHAYGNWMAYIKKFRPAIASLLDFPALERLEIPARLPGMPIDLFDARLENILLANAAARQSTAQKNIKLFFDFLRNVAQSHLGRTYMVKLPFLLYNTESESGRLITSYEVTQEAFLDITENSFDDLDSIRRELLASNDGRFAACGVYWNTSGFDLKRASENESVIAPNNDFFTKVNVNPKIYFIPEPAVIVGMPQGGFREIDESFNPLGTILNTANIVEIAGGAAAAFAAAAAAVANPALAASATCHFRVHPRPVKPSACHIPLKSNILTYGPWYASQGTVAGNVRYEKDSSLVPWNYGGVTYMNLAANAKIQTSISSMTYAETGMLELEGTPQYSLGATLDSNGPNVTDINVSYSVQGGATTTYRFSTYVPRFGQIGKFLQDRIRNVGLLSQQYAKNAKESILEGSVKADRIREANISRDAYLFGLPRGINLETPYNMIIGVAEGDASSDEGAVRHGISTTDISEALFLLNPTGTEYNSSVTTTLNSFLTPVSILGSGKYMSQMTLPSAIWLDTGLINAKTYNPYKESNDGWSTDYFTFGDSYPTSGINTFTNNSAVGSGTRRVFALKGPLILSSWGYDLNGNVVPGTGLSFANKHLVRPNVWKTGPIDLLWDDNRKVWTSHDILKGKLNGTLAAKSSGQMRVYQGSGNGIDTGWNINVYNWMNTSISSGVRVFAGYVMTDNQFNIISADCN